MSKIIKSDTILITGAGGGLGVALIALLKENGFNNLLTPTKDDLDLLNLVSLIDYFSKNKPKSVIHLASIVFGLQGNIDNQMLSLVNNTQINANLFSVINDFPVEYVFFAGTVASYSYPYKNIPLIETDFFNGLPHHGEFGYAMSKRHAYSYLKILAETKSIRFNYGVFTNLYGEHDRFNQATGHVIPSLIVKAFNASQHGEALTVWGDGSAQRDFLHFKDAAKAILTCLEVESSEQLLNISSGVGVSIAQLTELVARAAGVANVEFLTDKPVGIKSRVVDNSLLKSIGFSQSIALDTGIKDLYNWYLSNVNKVRT